MSLTIQQCLVNFKSLIENAILTGGKKGITSAIRSSTPILNIHEAVKWEFVQKGVAAVRIFPPLDARKPELKLAGSLKQKHQDVCIIPARLSPKEEVMTDGLLKGVKDAYGKTFTERTISINVRSQMSSLQKNFDTLFERTFSEAQNLHERCPKMCLGEVYMIAVPEYDDRQFDANNIVLKKPRRQVVEQYIRSFLSINNRHDTKKHFYQYERVCLLIVDFTQNPPKLYTSDQELKDAGLLAEDSDMSIASLNWDSFAASLLAKWEERFGKSGKAG
ncbi:MAG: hypothetical protein EPO28_18075 [Saprospiraceae bacterium]|nr:MAG: hypothetical protein EPO28_18075 [Saprospiraceae bacterium]